jgi:hypothetical protein
MSLKTVGIKNKSLFLVSIEIIDRYHKKTVSVTINYFFSSEMNKHVYHV